MRTHLRRTGSLAPLLALVGGGLGRPLFDAVVFLPPDADLGVHFPVRVR